MIVLVEQQEKSQKHFDLSAFNWNLNSSNLCTTVGAMTFQKRELFSGSPSISDEPLKDMGCVFGTACDESYLL